MKRRNLLASSPPIVPPAETGRLIQTFIKAIEIIREIELAEPHVSTPDLYANAPCHSPLVSGIAGRRRRMGTAQYTKIPDQVFHIETMFGRRHGRNQDRRSRDVKQPSSASVKKNLINLISDSLPHRSCNTPSLRAERVVPTASGLTAGATTKRRPHVKWSGQSARQDSKRTPTGSGCS